MKHAVRVGALRQAYESWEQTYTDSKHFICKDIHFPLRWKVRPHTLPETEEKFIVASVLFFADNNTPLNREGIPDLIKEYVSLLPETRKGKIEFRGTRPSNNRMTSFLKRNGLNFQHVECMEDNRVRSVSPENLIYHTARVNAAIEMYNIKDLRFILNTDQSGSSFGQIKERSLRKGIGATGAWLFQKTWITNENLDRVTVISVVSAACVAYEPAILFPGTFAHHRKVRGQTRTQHSVLPPSFLFQRNPPGADSDVVFERAKHFVEETSNLRRTCNRLLLLLDDYGFHVQYRTPRLLRENNIIFIALYLHTSHKTQSLDVGVFSLYKSFLQSELHKVSTQKTKMNALDVAQCILNAYYSSQTAPKTRSEFYETGIWDIELLRPNIAPLEKCLLQSN